VAAIPILYNFSEEKSEANSLFLTKKYILLAPFDQQLNTTCNFSQFLKKYTFKAPFIGFLKSNKYMAILANFSKKNMIILRYMLGKKIRTLIKILKLLNPQNLNKVEAQPIFTCSYEKVCT